MQRVCCHLSITLVVYLLLPAAAMAQVIIGPGPGGDPQVLVIDSGGTRTVPIFGPAFLGGASVTLGDVNGDGTMDIIAGAGPGGGPHVRVLSGVDLTELASFYAYPLEFPGGVHVAAGDINGDGRADIITGAGPGGGPHVRVFSGADLTELASFYAYDPAFPGGVSVAAGDINGDGRADIITGAGPSGGPHVRAFSGVDLSELASFYAYPLEFPGGVSVAAGDINGDGLADIITGAGPSGGPHVRVFSGDDLTELASFYAYDPAFGGGVNVAVGDIDGDGRVDLILGAGPGGDGLVRILSGVDFSELDSFFAPPGMGSGISVGSVGDLPGLRFTSAVTTTFMVGAPGTFTVTTVGNPAPTITSTAALPADVTFVDNGDGTATLAGTPAPGTGGTYALTFTASNGLGAPAVQTFTLSVSGAPAFTSAAATTFPINAHGTFAVTTTGFPIPTITRGGAALPTAITWIDNGDGTGTLSGTAAAGTGGTYALTFTADNGVGAPVVQTFTLTVNGAPAFTSANTAAFTLNTPGTTFQVVTTGSPAPTVSVTAGALPTGLTLSSAGLLSGTPTQSGSFPVTLTATNGTLPNATQAFTVAVNAPPAITSGNTDTFTVGTADSFTVTTTGFPAPTVSQTGALPAGVMFTAATRVLGGTPTQTGVFPLVFTATNGTPPDATQNFTLNVVCPAIVVNAATMTDGLYQVAYAGVTFTQTGSTGSSITWSATGLPAGVMIGATTGVVSGTPTDTVLNGAVVIIATDNFGCQGTFNATMTVRPSTDPENYIGGVGHTQYATGAPFPATPHVAFVDNVKTGDNGPAPLFVTFPATSTNGGTIVEGATDGTFIYTPALTFGGPSDTFTYTLTDANGVTNTGTVTINLSNIVWYVNSSGGAGDGRSHSPFNTLNAAATPSGSTHIIYVHSGGATTTGNLAMDANQTLQGQGATFTLNGLTIPVGTRPTLTGTLTLADNTTVRAVNFTPSGIPAMAASGVSFAQPVTIDQVNVTGGTSAVSLTNVTATATGAINVSNAAFTNTSAAEVLISQGTIPVTLAATATISSNAGRSVDIQNRTGGTVSFNGAITDTGQGVFLNANIGSTINFTGGLSLSTTTNPGFTATNGGTVSATQNNTTIVNTISTTTGAALNVANTTIGASGLTFRSMSAGTGVSGPAKGIILNVTGVGAFTVTGTGGAGSGGTIQNASSRGAEFISVSNVTLSDMVFNNNGIGGAVGSCGDALGATTTGSFVTAAGCLSNLHVQTVTSATLNRITANDSDGHGLNGYQIGGLTLNAVSVERNGNEVGEDGVQLVNSTGTVTVSGASTFRDNASNQFEAQNGSGTATFAVSGAFFGLTNFPTTGAAEAPSPGSGTANSGLLISGSGTANMTATVTGSTFDENYANGYLSDTAGSATMNITMGTGLSGNAFTNNGVPIEIVNVASGSLTYVIRNNTITNATAITGTFATTAITAARSGTGSAMTGTIDGNTIGTPGTADSGCFVTLCDGISLPDSATSSANAYHATVTNNQINHVHSGISSNIGGISGGQPRTSFVITGNTIQNPFATTQGNGIVVNSGTLPDNVPQTCVEISANTLSGAWSALNGDSIRYRHRGAAGSTFRVRNFTTGGDITAFVTGTNTFGAGTVDPFGFQLVGSNVFTGGTAACPQ